MLKSEVQRYLKGGYADSAANQLHIHLPQNAFTKGAAPVWLVLGAGALLMYLALSIKYGGLTPQQIYFLFRGTNLLPHAGTEAGRTSRRRLLTKGGGKANRKRYSLR